MAESTKGTKPLFGVVPLELPFFFFGAPYRTIPLFTSDFEWPSLNLDVSKSRRARHLIDTAEVSPKTHEELVIRKVRRATVFRREEFWKISQAMKWVSGKSARRTPLNVLYLLLSGLFIRALGEGMREEGDCLVTL